MTGLDLDRIEATARAATPGRWHEFDGCVWTDAAECLHHGPSSVADREHVATMDPETTLALVARVRELEAEMGERIFWLDQDAGLIAEAMERLSAAEAQLKGRCLADITLRDDDHRMVTCILPEGHTFEHDDGMGCLWTDGDHRAADHSDAARLTAVDKLHRYVPCAFGEEEEVSALCYRHRDRGHCPRCGWAIWPCPTHLAVHPECAANCQHVGGAA